MVLFIGWVVVTFILAAMGRKRGLIKSVISLVTLMITSATVALVANGISNYTQGQILNVFVMVVLLTALGLVQLLLKPIFFSAKMIVELPIVSWLDKLCGFALGLAEGVLLLWTVYFFSMIMDLGGIGSFILEMTASNPVLTFLYQNNYLALGLNKFFSSVQIPETVLQFIR